jgi:hypothetical protein
MKRRLNDGEKRIEMLNQAAISLKNTVLFG